MNERREHNGHIHPMVDNWAYPCLGCGKDASESGDAPCAQPWSDPVVAVHKLEEIHGVLVEIRDLLRAWREGTRT